jgi:hypothetical protein
MAREVERPEGLATRILVGIVALVVAWWLIKLLLGFLFSLVRIVMFVALFAVIAWVVLVGSRDSRGP